MNLTEFKIENYRSVRDSGWINVDDVIVIVGKNESGKTSLLRALWKFNPYDESGYDIDREWPRGHRKAKSADKTVATCRFTFSPEEIEKLETTHESAKGIHSVEIRRSCKGEYFHTFQPTAPAREHEVSWVIDLVNSRIHTLLTGFSDHFKGQFETALREFIDAARQAGASAYVVEQLPQFKGRLPQFGMRARLWHFMASHDHLAIWLTDGSGLNQYLVLSGCTEISAPVSWRVTQPRLVPDDQGVLEFADQGVRIICQDASIHAEYKRTADA